MASLSGCSPRPAPELDGLVHRHAAAGDWPGAAYAAGPPDDVPAWLGARGCLTVDPAPEPARLDALYDLASLTKPLATGPLVLRLAGRGLVDPDRPLDDLLPELAGYAGRTPSFTDLLLHRAGLPAWAPLYRLVEAAADVPAAIAGLPPAGPAGAAPLYGCPGPVLAGIALERRTGRWVGDLFRDEIAAPLGLAGDLFFGPVPAGERARCAPTERGRAWEAAMADRFAPAPGTVAPGPDEPIRGNVHDGNAFFLGGAAGNSGLFGTAAAVFRLASALVTPGRLLDAAAMRRITEPGIRGPEDVRTFGFRHGSGARETAGALGAHSIGHVGFTGTSAWIALDPPRVAVLLSNRVHPRCTEVPIRAWRRDFHDAVAAMDGGSPRE